MESPALGKPVAGIMTATSNAFRFQTNSAFGSLLSSSGSADIIEIQWKEILEVKALGGGFGAGIAKPFKLRLTMSERAEVNASQL